MDSDEILYGTELRADIFRAISPDEVKSLEIFVDISLPVILIILLLCIICAQLPTWMFLNSLSLIVHTTLLNSLMPPSVFYVFKKYLDIIRLNSADFNEYIEDNFEMGRPKEDSLSFYLQSSDYNQLFVQNLSIILISAIVLLLVWIAIMFFARKHEP